MAVFNSKNELRLVHFQYEQSCGEIVRIPAYSDISFHDRDALCYLSCILSSKNAKKIVGCLNKKNAYKLQIEAPFNDSSYTATFYVGYPMYDVTVYNDGETSHMILKLKVGTGRNFDKNLNFQNLNYINVPIFTNQSSDTITEEMSERIFECISKYTTLPMLKEWAYPIISRLFSINQPYSNRSYSVNTVTPVLPNVFYDRNLEYGINMEIDKNNFNISNSDIGFKYCYIASVSINTIKNEISNALSHGVISINGSNHASDEIVHTYSFDEYINNYGNILIDKLVNKFKPKFNPLKETLSKEVQEFSDIVSSHSDVIPYDAQLNAMEAINRNMDVNKTTFLSAEMGSGKTVISIGAVHSHAKRKNRNRYASLVMCPGTMVLNWKDAIKESVPFSEVYVVETLAELISLRKRIEDRNRQRPIWGIITYGVAKDGYEEHPNVVFNKITGRYECSHCHEDPIFPDREIRDNGVFRPGTRLDVMKVRKTEYASRIYSTGISCRQFFKKIERKTCRVCGSPLWGASTKKNISNWVKVPGIGWLETDRINDLKEYYRSYPFPKESKKLNEYVDSAKKPVSKMPIKFSFSKYILRYMKNYFNYFIADECHKLSGDSNQGEAFGEIVKVVNNVVCLTGTLSNGYAGSMYHLLFRTCTRKMISLGYKYGSEKKFSEKYGTSETKIVYDCDLRRENIHDFEAADSSMKRRLLRRRSRSTTTKQTPGVSPLLFNDFLLNNTVFLFQQDITKDLVQYSEIPMPIEMDTELKEEYERVSKIIINDIKDKKNDRKAVKNSINYLSMALDQPYGLDSPKDTSNACVCEPIDLDDEIIREKEKALIDIVKRKKEAGEKCLIYTHWTNKLDIQNRLRDLLEAEDIDVEIMNDVEQKSRQQWLDNKAKEIDALIVNPKLIEVGLNLLDYTTIIFYEIGNELSVIRQSSRRSWRLNQTHPVEVYFLYYANTVQEQLLSVMSMKMRAALAVEGNFNEEGISAMSENIDILNTVANNIVNNINVEVNIDNFEKIGSVEATQLRLERIKNAIKINKIGNINYMDTILREKASKKKLPKVSNNSNNHVVENNVLLNLFKICA